LLEIRLVLPASAGPDGEFKAPLVIDVAIVVVSHVERRSIEGKTARRNWADFGTSMKVAKNIPSGTS
jgi:hypothetical protein